jgi:hypothetical protein
VELVVHPLVMWAYLPQQILAMAAAAAVALILVATVDLVS